MRQSLLTRTSHTLRTILVHGGTAGLTLLALAGGAHAQTFTLSPTPLNQDVCVGDDIAIQVRVRSGDGYIFPVKVTLPNLPANLFLLASAPNPVVPGPSGNVNLRLTATGGSSVPYDLIIRGTGSNGATASASARVDVANIPGAPVPRIPENGFSTSTTPTLEWTGSMGAKSFRVQISTDDNFPDTAIVYEGFIAAQTNNAITVDPPLTAGQTYFWRVRGTNRCGDGFDSPIFSFVTDGMCAPLDLAISDGGSAGVAAELSLPSGAALADVDVQVLSDHPRAGDLDLRIAHHGQEVRLLDAGGCNAPNVAARFDDAAAGAASGSCNANPNGNAIAGALRPAQPLSVFNGLPGNGTYRVSVRDANANGLSGRLRGICIQTRSAPEAGALFASGME